MPEIIKTLTRPEGYEVRVSRLDCGAISVTIFDTDAKESLDFSMNWPPNFPDAENAALAYAEKL